MQLILVFFIVLFGSLMTFFSGFGLGTILLPVFLFFFPLKTAIFATALVHVSNSFFKFIFLKKHIHWSIFILFGLPATLSAFFGSYLLTHLNDKQIFFQYSMFEKDFQVTTTTFIVSFLIMLFTLIELFAKNIQILKQNNIILLIGGILSGFFGGLSGHQGALRSLFLKKVDLSKEELVATSTVISMGIDLIRLTVYFVSFSFLKLWTTVNEPLLWTGVVAAFLGALIGNKALKKVSLMFIHYFISILLLLFSILMMIGML
ncbi:MAG: sulfite exporter TauE/SafE family protein [Flavobacteriia bacterium]|nr:sulfite exporter TauE/SafE family protein [Flavobacteriia bacterium]